MPVHLADRERPFWGYAEILVVTALFLVSGLVAATLMRAASPYLHINTDLGWSMLMVEALGYAAVFGSMKLLFARYGEPLFRSLAWIPYNFKPQHLVITGLLLYVGIVILGNLLGLPNVETPFEKLLKDPVSRIVIALFGVSVGPIVEELLFRGLLQPVLVDSFGALYGILGTAVLFGGMHLMQNAFLWQSGVLITIVGFVLGVIRHVSGSTRASAITHVSYNALPFLVLLISGKA